MTLSAEASLKPFNTFGIDARARYMARFDSRDALLALFDESRLQALPHMILGGGSNVLFTDDYDGVILKNEVRGIACIEEDDEHYYVRAGAGENWHHFVLHCLAQGWAGLENLSLIPGNVGAGPMQNIGAYGVEIKDRFHSLRALEIATGRVKEFDAAACAFGYRESVFKGPAKGQYIILDVTFRLLKEPRLSTHYGAISSELQRMGIENPGIQDVSRAVISIRESKLPNPAVLGNAGSFFKNPIVDEERFVGLRDRFAEMPHYPTEDGKYKLAAGWLIEKAGWKGKRMGQVGMHAQQALVLVNYGNASGRELWEHSQRVLEDVQEKFGIALEREVNVIGPVEV